MSKYSDESLKSWSRPANTNELAQVKRTKDAVRKAIKAYPALQGKSIDIFVQGSHSNDTNVLKGSDIDICVLYKGNFMARYPQGKKARDYPRDSDGKKFAEFRSDVNRALHAEFGDPSVSIRNKSILVNSRSYQVQADVVPAFLYLDYLQGKGNQPVEGIHFTSGKGKEVVNFPKQHLKNGQTKNSLTSKKYKVAVRIMKKLRERMPVDKAISSFLIEGMLYNVPDNLFKGSASLNTMLDQVTAWMLEHTSNPSRCGTWTEVSGHLPLFSKKRKWNPEKAHIYLRNLRKELGYS